MTSLEYASAARAVSVLPNHASRRLTRRDGLLPLVFALELLAGVAFGLASHSVSPDATSSSARLTLESAVTLQPPLTPLANVTRLTAPVTPPRIGPVAPAVEASVGAPAASSPHHPPRDPFLALASI